MKKRLFFLSLLMIGGGNLIIAQKMGINTKSPKATLDIKNEGNNTEVLRFSSKPADFPSTNKNFVLFVGEEIDGGYNLRKTTLNNLIPQIIEQIPSLKRIVTKNNNKQTFKQGIDTTINLDTEITNTATNLYELDKSTKSIKILESGIYDVSSWVGFKELGRYDGDIVVSLAKSNTNGNNFENFKRVIISRTLNNAKYSNGKGVGASFSFTEEFRTGEKIRLQVIAIDTDNIETLNGSVNITVSRTK